MFIRVSVTRTLTVLHQALAVPVAPAAAPLVPHVGVVALGVLVLHPSRLGGDGDDVKNDSEDQQQGNDPPAAGVCDSTAKHVRPIRERGSRGKSVRGGSCVQLNDRNPKSQEIKSPAPP